MEQLARGQKKKLSDLTAATHLDIGVSVPALGSRVLDVSCFGLDAQDRLSDDRYFIFYNQKSSPCGSITALGAQQGDSEVFRLDLAKLPASVRRLVFTVTLDGTGTMAELPSSHLQLRADGRPVARFDFSGKDFGGERAVMIAEIYWKESWRFAAIGQGFNGGLSALLTHFGGEESSPASPPPAPPSPPPAPPASTTPTPVRLSKITLDKRGSKQTVELKKGGGQQPIHINLNWDNPNGGRRKGLFGLGPVTEAPDLDLGCMLRMANGGKDVIQPLGGNFGSRNSPPFIHLDKDDRTGAASDGENLYILRPDLIDRVMVFAFIYDGVANFSQVNGRLRIRDQAGNEILVPLNNPEGSRTFCSICLIENRGDRVEVIKEERYFSGHREADQHYGFGFEWTKGHK
jgi:tellurite resistance protein TerA